MMLKIDKLNEETIVITQSANQDVIARMKLLQKQPDSQRMELLGIILEDQEEHNNTFEEIITTQYLETRHVLFPFNECTEPMCHLSRCNNPAARILVEREFAKQISKLEGEELDIAVYGAGGFYTELYILLQLNPSVKKLNLHLTNEKFNELVEYAKDMTQLDINTIQTDREDKTDYFRVKFFMFSRIIQWMRATGVETNIYVHSTCQLDIDNIMDVVVGIDMVDEFANSKLLNFRDLVVSSIKPDGIVLACIAGIGQTNIRTYIAKFVDYIEDRQIEELEKLIENIESQLKSQKRYFIELNDMNDANVSLFYRPNKMAEIQIELNEGELIHTLTLDELKKYIINENVDVSDMELTQNFENLNIMIYEGNQDLIQVKHKNKNKLDMLRIEDFYDHMLEPIISITPYWFCVKSLKIMQETRSYWDLCKIWSKEMGRACITIILAIPDALYSIYGALRHNRHQFGMGLPYPGTMAYMFNIKGPTNVYLSRRIQKKNNGTMPIIKLSNPMELMKPITRTKSVQNLDLLEHEHAE